MEESGCIESLVFLLNLTKKPHEAKKQLSSVFLSFPSKYVSQILIFFNIYFFLRERESQSASGGGAERVGDIESATGSELSAQSPMWGSNSQAPRS